LIRFYNKTPYSGLETHIANSYANPLLQLYRFIPIIRNLSLLHTATSCLLPDCMLCQLGFLTDMLEKAEGQNCQATNFLKTFSSISAAAQLNLLEEHSNAARTALTNTIQAVNRFLLERFLTDFRLVAPTTPYLEQTLTTKLTTTIRCAHCSHEQMRQDSPSSLDLIYPGKVHVSLQCLISSLTIAAIIAKTVSNHILTDSQKQRREARANEGILPVMQ
jgi:PAB-dependent poly(A)-specific ribonuclease subunit 2